MLPSCPDGDGLDDVSLIQVRILSPRLGFRACSALNLQAKAPAPPQYGHIDLGLVALFNIARDLKFQVTRTWIWAREDARSQALCPTRMAGKENNSLTYSVIVSYISI